MNHSRPSIWRRIVSPPLVRLLPLLTCLLFASCASTTKWNMMPTPTVHQYIGESAFETLDDNERSPSIEIFYATNRPASGSTADRDYDNGIVDHLQVGKAVVHFGDRRMKWRDLLQISTRAERRQKIPLELHQVTELTARGTGADSFASELNLQLAADSYREITVYVHGANSSFFKACVQGAQFHHFMARQGALISFSWPSTGRFLSYDKDVEFAGQSVEQFADMIELLAAGTKAEKINILSYSAGAQMVAPGLAALRKRYPAASEAALRRRFRIGEVYFAASDVSLVDFTQVHMPAFQNIVDRTTVSFHRQDGVLSWAASAHRESRLGRPDDDELSDDDIAFLERAARESRLDAIDMQYSQAERPLDFKAHSSWYANEWVSSDVIIQFLFHIRPDQRGLKVKPGTESWYFPADYGDTLRQIVDDARRAEN